MRRGNYGGKREDDKEGRLEDFMLEFIGMRRADKEELLE
jgi:hypothetical protein